MVPAADPPVPDRVAPAAATLAARWLDQFDAGNDTFTMLLEPAPDRASAELVAEHQARQVLTHAAFAVAAQTLTVARGIPVTLRPTLNGWVITRCAA